MTWIGTQYGMHIYTFSDYSGARYVYATEQGEVVYWRIRSHALNYMEPKGFSFSYTYSYLTPRVREVNMETLKECLPKIYKPLFRFKYKGEKFYGLLLIKDL